MDSTGSQTDRHAVSPLAAGSNPILILTAVIAGVLLAWFVEGWRGESPHHWVALGVAVVITAFAPLRRTVTRGLEHLRVLALGQVRRLAFGVFVFVCAYCFATAWWQGRDMFPNWHDQQMTLTQAQMLAHGRLWMPQHPCADFFETFYVFVKPLYAAMYFPGGALFYVPAVWLRLPSWVLPVLACGAVAALLFRVVTRVLDPAAGLLAVVMLVGLWIFRLLSIWSMSHSVFTLLALWAVWSWMQWRGREAPSSVILSDGEGSDAGTSGGSSSFAAAQDDKVRVGRAYRLGWAASLGAALGWMGITRPVDAVAYGIPLGLAVLWDLRLQPARRWLASLGVMVLAAAPFLALQLVEDKGITGRWLTPPNQVYFDREMPGMSAYGGKSVGEVKVTTTLEQKRYFWEHAYLPARRKFAAQTWPQVVRERAAAVLRFALPSERYAAPSVLVVVLFACGVLGLRRRDARVVVLVAPVFLFVVGYSLYFEMLDHYCVTVAPGVLLCVVLGVTTVASALGRYREVVYTGLAVAVVALSVAALPEFRRAAAEDQEPYDDGSWPATTFNYEELPGQAKAPALVLYRFSRKNVNDEPVYNIEAPWPDDARIIRAHDLGARDAEIIEYYGRVQPERNVYFVDRADLQVHSLGTARELAARLKEGKGLPAELNAAK